TTVVSQAPRVLEPVGVTFFRRVGSYLVDPRTRLNVTRGSDGRSSPTAPTWGTPSSFTPRHRSCPSHRQPDGPTSTTSSPPRRPPTGIDHHHETESPAWCRRARTAGTRRSRRR